MKWIKAKIFNISLEKKNKQLAHVPKWDEDRNINISRVGLDFFSLKSGTNLERKEIKFHIIMKENLRKKLTAPNSKTNAARLSELSSRALTGVERTTLLPRLHNTDLNIKKM